MQKLTYRILLRKEPEGGYTVLVPALPGCITYGKTIEEAIKMAKEAIDMYWYLFFLSLFLCSHSHLLFYKGFKPQTTLQKSNSFK